MAQRGVALVRSSTRSANTSSFTFEESSYLVMKGDGPDAVGSFMVEVDQNILQYTIDNQFRCPACNYQVIGATGWLAVPHRRERTDCMEAISFYSLGADLSLDVSVFVDPKPLAALPALKTYLDALSTERTDNSAADVQVQAWMPPAHRASPPPGLRGARAELRLRDHQPTRHHLVTLGSLRYLLVLRGDDEAMHSEGATEILDSFEILNPNLAPEQLASMPVTAHSGGGRFDGRIYINPTYLVTFEGPEGWEHSLQAAGCLFEVRFDCPLGQGTLWTRAHGPPVGLDRWYQNVADSWLSDYCAAQGMEVVDEGGWQDSDSGFRLRTMTTTAPRGSEGATAVPRIIRLAMAEDLLLVLHGYGTDATGRALVMQSFDSLRRLD